MAIDTRGHVAPANTENPKRRSLNDLSLTTNDIIASSTATDRATKASALVSALSTAALPALSATNVAWFHQSDTTHLWRYDGTNWRDYGAGGAQPFVAGSGLTIPNAADYGVGTFTATVGGSGGVISTGTLDSLTFTNAGIITMHCLYYIPTTANRYVWMDGKNAHMSLIGSSADRVSLSYTIQVTAGMSISFGWRQESGASVAGCTTLVRGIWAPA